MAKRVIKSENAPAPIGPYSQAIQFGNFLFISGQIALDPKTGLMDNTDILTETKRVLQNLDAILSEAGFAWDDVIKASIFLKDLNDFTTVNELYGHYFKANPPARETVQVAKLPKDARVEISLIVAKQ